MRWFIVFITILTSAMVLAFVPITSDFALLINRFDCVKDLLPQGTFTSEVPGGFVCFFGKLTLNLAMAFEVFESEELEDMQNVAEISVVTDEPEWVRENLSEIIQNSELIESNGLYYFASPSMIEDVKALIEGRVSSLELDRTKAIHGRLRTVPLLGILLHLIGLNEGIPIEDEFVMDMEGDKVNLLITSKKACKSDWELTQLEKKDVPQGLKTLVRADVRLLLPTSLLKQVPAEFLEEFALDLGGLEEILAKSSYTSISMAQEEEKILISFNLQEKDVQDVLNALEAKGLESKQEAEFITYQGEDFTLKVPLKGGIGLLFYNVNDEDMKDVEPGAILRFALSLEGSIVDVSLFRDACSVIVKANVSSALLREALAEIFSEFVPEPAEIEILRNIVQAIDDAYYFQGKNPPENLQELEALLGQDLPENVLYSCREEDGTLVAEIGIVSPVALTLSEWDVMELMYYNVAEVRIDKEKQIIFIFKNYEKYEMPPVSETIQSLVEAFRSYVADYEDFPDSLEEVVLGYTWLPYSVIELIDYEADANTRTITLKLASDEEVDETLIEELALEKLFREDGWIVVIFKVE
ncbi:MAG: hypothetical protein XD58_0826 [Thermotoga sp. 50_1627]|uniref:hypothetical protein n=1 Tax=Pseudothermotoga sp. TaxID=2033661 RepID=UPI00076DD0E1|nr:MAG: hypothetical protein XD45_1094 [Thermotoga sp. 50_64]KUK25204.1 MAG: hypothetical protein XD58_0826 [Thermotoga sp. 50_1627]MBC7116839.1 hypothetical protein [Pseudothermotoga sp.]MDK2923207.1 hypothetical protein [Pseudothermotoga sp.]HBT39404.1 hypothetical protein [Pseudothermotoga sp.]